MPVSSDDTTANVKFAKKKRLSDDTTVNVKFAKKERLDFRSQILPVKPSTVEANPVFNSTEDFAAQGDRIVSIAS